RQFEVQFRAGNAARAPAERVGYGVFLSEEFNANEAAVGRALVVAAYLAEIAGGRKCRAQQRCNDQAASVLHVCLRSPGPRIPALSNNMIDGACVGAIVQQRMVLWRICL